MLEILSKTYLNYQQMRNLTKNIEIFIGDINTDVLEDNFITNDSINEFGYTKYVDKPARIGNRYLNTINRNLNCRSNINYVFL